MHVLGWVLATVMIVLFCTAVGFGLVFAIAWLGRLVRGVARARRYQRAHARHVLGDPVEGHWADTAEFYGSMTLDGERVPDGGYWLPYWDEAARGRAVLLPAPPELAHDWREQTAADLAPEALDGEREFLTTIPGTRMTIWAPSGEVEFTDPPEDPGPGGASSLGVSVPPGPDQAPVVELGPRAALVLARWEARRAERWSLRWDNEVAA